MVSSQKQKEKKISENKALEQRTIYTVRGARAEDFFTWGGKIFLPPHLFHVLIFTWGGKEIMID